jgi:hypothetical protein
VRLPGEVVGLFARGERASSPVPVENLRTVLRKNAEEFAGVMTEESSDSPLYIPTKNDLFRGIAEGPK